MLAENCGGRPRDPVSCLTANDGGARRGYSSVPRRCIAQRVDEWTTPHATGPSASESWIPEACRTHMAQGRRATAAREGAMAVSQPGPVVKVEVGRASQGDHGGSPCDAARRDGAAGSRLARPVKSLERLRHGITCCTGLPSSHGIFIM
jgi:hypothetical protein